MRAIVIQVRTDSSQYVELLTLESAVRCESTKSGLSLIEPTKKLRHRFSKFGRYLGVHEEA
jgi:hypothetical protein